YAVEFAGQTIEDMSIEGRLTLCNLAVELGAKYAQIAPDDTTFTYVRDRPFAPQGELFERAVEDWRALSSDADAVFDCEVQC
ncbi:aconitase family protein, partial [Acinetobacter baumannii]